MKKSEFLKQAKQLAENTSLTTLWENATGKPWEENADQFDSELGLFFMDIGEFVIVPYVQKLDSGWKRIFEEQKTAIFIGWVGDRELIEYSTPIELLEQRIDELKYDEEQNELQDSLK